MALQRRTLLNKELVELSLADSRTLYPIEKVQEWLTQSIEAGASHFEWRSYEDEDLSMWSSSVVFESDESYAERCRKAEAREQAQVLQQQQKELETMSALAEKYRFDLVEREANGTEE